MSEVCDVATQGGIMRGIVVLAFTAILALPLPLLAAPPEKGGPANHEMDEMVVTATRTEEPLKSIPGRVEVITREDLKEMPVQTVDEALSYISGAHGCCTKTFSLC